MELCPSGLLGEPTGTGQKGKVTEAYFRRRPYVPFFSRRVRVKRTLFRWNLPFLPILSNLTLGKVTKPNKWRQGVFYQF